MLSQAGLFSTGLTAFLAESYAMLQEDNSETTKLLLARISAQMENWARSGNPDPTTIPPLSAPFQPTGVAVWVNALWFLSLISSLGAGFLGIRVRQWLREYMQWNAALAHPRENVLVRQIRFDALTTWKVLESISCIPAMLEAALVLFVSGIVVLLWSLNTAVAIVVTIAVSILIAVATTTAALPFFLRRCPYKSPTAWGCLLLWNLVLRLCGLSFWMSVHAEATVERQMHEGLSVLQSYVRAIHAMKWTTPRFWTWRSRDLDSARVSKLRSRDGRMLDAIRVVQEEFFTNSEEGSIPDGRSAAGARQVPHEGELQSVLWEMGQATWLFKALVWVLQASQDPGLHRRALKCAESLDISLHAPKESSLITPSCVSHLIDLYLLGRPWDHDPQSALLSRWGPTNISTAIPSVRHLLQQGYESCLNIPGPLSLAVAQHRFRGHQDPRNRLPFTDTAETKLLTIVLSSRLTRCMTSQSVSVVDSRQRSERAFQLISALFYLKGSHGNGEFHGHRALLTEVYNNIACARHASPDLDLDFAGVLPAILTLLFDTNFDSVPFFAIRSGDAHLRLGQC